MFANRRDAGRQLARKLKDFVGAKNLLVLALPRGGVPVAAEVAKYLGAPLDVFVVRKIGVPDHEELAMGAIASGGKVVRNEEVLRYLGLKAEAFERVCAQEAREVERRERLYRGKKMPLALQGKTVILVDDGIATGSSIIAAVEAVRQLNAAHVVVAVPVVAPQIFEKISRLADRLVAVIIPADFFAVGAWYEDFSQTDDAEVRAILQGAETGHTSIRSDFDQPQTFI